MALGVYLLLFVAFFVLYASSDALHHVNRLQAEMSFCKLYLIFYSWLSVDASTCTFVVHVHTGC